MGQTAGQDGSPLESAINIDLIHNIKLHTAR